MSASSNSASGLNPECPGLGVPRKPRLWLRWLRRASQVVFLGLFFFLLFQTEFRGTFARGATEAIRLDYPVSIFLEMDPLVAFSTALATHEIYGKVIWALVLIAGAILAGRFFCGWVAPLGPLNHFFSSYKPERKGMKRIGSQHYKRWVVTTKYHPFPPIQ